MNPVKNNFFREVEELIPWLHQLDPATQPLWGTMTAQHMVEHLTASVKISVGMPEIQVHNTQELAEKFKAALIHTDRPLSRGIKNPALPEHPLPLRHAKLSDAVEELQQEWNRFKEYYQANPQAQHNHPRLGKLSHAEWVIFHGKHFSHHLEQFGLV